MVAYRGYRGVGPEEELAALLVQSRPPEASPQALEAVGATQATEGLGPLGVEASRSREIADLLTNRAMGRNATSIATGLSQLGEAYLANKANKRADGADAAYAARQDELVAAAMGGDMQALAQLDLGAAINQKNADQARGDRLARQEVEDQRYDAQWDHQLGREAVEDGRYTEERDYRQQRDGVADAQFQAQMDQGQAQFEAGRDLDLRMHNDRMGLEWTQLESAEEAARAKAAAEAGENASLNPGLQGLPPGVQSAIVGDELDVLSGAKTELDRTGKLVDIADQFMGQSKGYHALGGGMLANVGQMFSQKTAGLKGLTEQAVKLSRVPGEGPMTDADATRAQQATVHINQGRGGNEAVQAAYKAQRENAMAYDNFLRNFQNEHGYGSLSQAQQVWNAYGEANPVYDADTGAPVAQRVPIDAWLSQQAAAMRAEEIAAERAALMAEEEAEARNQAYDMRGME